MECPSAICQSTKIPHPCVSVHYVPIPPVFFNEATQFVFVMEAQAKALLKSMERFPMSLTVSGTLCISLRPSQLTFLQCHGREYYENQPHSVNSATAFHSVKLFPSLPCTQLFEAQHHFSMCIAWVEAQFHPDFIHGKGKVCHSGCTSSCKLSFIYQQCIYKNHRHTQDIYMVQENVIHFKGQTICRHACVRTRERLAEDGKPKVGQSFSYE